MVNSQRPKDPLQFTEYGIPIRNLWHMLLYAWNEVPLNALREWALEAVEHAPTLDALLASVLVKLMQQRLRIGLAHDYVDEKQTLRGLRGRIDFAGTLKSRSLERSQVVCESQTYSANSLKNQIIRSTIARLVKVGRFGAETDSVKEIHQKLRRLLRDLDGIDILELTPELIRRQSLARNDHDYRLMLAICDLIVQRTMPNGPGAETIVPVIDREQLVLYSVYERFVANFYRLHLKGWEVSAQKRLEWHASYPNERLPLMIPDLVLQDRSSDRLMIIDTKFTVHSLIENQWGKPVFDSSHLYQLYAYLKSQEHLSEAHRSAVGVLLYPAVEARLSERIELQDHLMRIESIDLAAPWQEVERQLLEVVRTQG
jgi:5-methylcytosine-specific restriction enzyme subunit McrC